MAIKSSSLQLRKPDCEIITAQDRLQEVIGAINKLEALREGLSDDQRQQLAELARSALESCVRMEIEWRR